MLKQKAKKIKLGGSNKMNSLAFLWNYLLLDLNIVLVLVVVYLI